MAQTKGIKLLMDYTYCLNIRDNIQIRQSFNNLAKKTFGLDFEFWYQAGYWTDKYIPHVLLDGEAVVSNISVNLINTSDDKLYIQLGTVMTDINYRNMGLSRFLLEKLIYDYNDKCDTIYLFANDSVLNFYPKFGFIKANEYQCQLPIIYKKEEIQKLDINNKNDLNLLIQKYKYLNPYSVFSVKDNIGLLMFYCLNFLKESIYYIKRYDTVVIAEYENDIMICYDIFSNNYLNLKDILAAVAKPNTKIVKLGFTPKSECNYIVSLLKEEDTTLFVLDSKENIFNDNKLMFPLLSHA